MTTGPKTPHAPLAQAIHRQAPFARRLALESIDRFIANGRAELVGQLLRTLALAVAQRLLGLEGPMAGQRHQGLVPAAAKASLLVAARVTVPRRASQALAQLLRHRELWQILCADPSLIPAAVEACLPAVSADGGRPDRACVHEAIADALLPMLLGAVAHALVRRLPHVQLAVRHRGIAPDEPGAADRLWVWWPADH